MAEEFQPVEAPPKKNMSPWVIVLIITVVICCCCLAIAIMFTLLGPADCGFCFCAILAA